MLFKTPLLLSSLFSLLSHINSFLIKIHMVPQSNLWSRVILKIDSSTHRGRSVHHEWKIWAIYVLWFYALYNKLRLFTYS
ncbi:hypothetical protein Bca101_082097 [Brassica carinata]